MNNHETFIILLQQFASNQLIIGIEGVYFVIVARTTITWSILSHNLFSMY